MNKLSIIDRQRGDTSVVLLTPIVNSNQAKKEISTWSYG